jgi:exodeoxyribonuclease VII large subunit
MEQMALSWEPGRRVFTVAELNAAMRGLFDQEFSDIWVAGEISDAKVSPSGHHYFSLKDPTGQIKCVCYKGTARFLKFKPQNGIAVLANGSLGIYEPRGECQLIVQRLEPQGHGALQLAFEQLKKKLAAQGLFDAARKRPLPKFPFRIGIVTSPTGAVIRDMLSILERRFPGLHIRLYPAQVQGEDAVEAVCEGLRYFSQSGWPDVVIVARGGGSLEDLWTFNEEAVARAIAASSAPVISAVGHETDFTIADFVADLRAPTPSAAAELVICTREEILDQIANSAQKLGQAMRYRTAEAHRRLEQQGIERATALLHRGMGRSMQRVDELDYGLRELVRAGLQSRYRRRHHLDLRLRGMDLRLRFTAAHRRLEAGCAALRQSAASHLTRAQRRLEPLAAQLAQLSPLRVLDRGYAIVQDASGHVLKDASETRPAAVLDVRLAKGRLRTRVTEIPEP